MRPNSTLPLLAAAFLATCLFAATAPAAVKTADVKYTASGIEFIGYLAYDDASTEARPGILIAPEWIGMNDYARSRAKQLAEMGYVAFVFDPYGGGKTAADVKQAGAWSTALKSNRPELRTRVQAAFATLKKQQHVDPKMTAAIGYCFGGTSVLELARDGSDVLGVVSFHGGLGTPTPAKAGEIKAKVLVLRGAEDPFVPAAEISAFEQEMRTAKADWQEAIYADAVHSFTNPEAKGQLPGAMYNEKADKRSWEAMKDFFAELFGKRPVAQADAGPIGPHGPLFGDGGRAKRIVFVIESSGHMFQKISVVKAQLQIAIGELREGQTYNALFFGEGGKIWGDPNRLYDTTEESLRAALQSVDEVTSSGDSDPIPALEAAFRQKPDLVYFLVVGTVPLENAENIVSSISKSNSSCKARVNTIQYSAKDPDAEKALRRIAKENDGSYRCVRDEDFVG